MKIGNINSSDPESALKSLLGDSDISEVSN